MASPSCVFDSLTDLRVFLGKSIIQMEDHLHCKLTNKIKRFSIFESRETKTKAATTAN